MTSVLLTGFEPFASATVNPSWDAAREVAARWDDASVTVRAVRLPVEFTRAAEIVRAEVESTQPSAVICLGLAEGRDAVTPERVAINLMDAPIPDNAGAQPREQPVVTTGPAAYFASLPVASVAAAMRAEGVPARVSLTAGSYVCNATFYALMHAIADTDIRGTFIHVPATPEVGVKPGTPTVELEQIVAAVTAAVRAALEPSSVAADASAGAVH